MDAHVVIEVYPALANDREGLQAHIPADVPAGTHERDACLCALMSVAFACVHPGLPPLVGPPAVDLEIEREGWIYYPV